jgi:Cysteine rich repeat
MRSLKFMLAMAVGAAASMVTIATSAQAADFMADMQRFCKKDAEKYCPNEIMDPKALIKCLVENRPKLNEKCQPLTDQGAQMLGMMEGTAAPTPPAASSAPAAAPAPAEASAPQAAAPSAPLAEASAPAAAVAEPAVVAEAPAAAPAKSAPIKKKSSKKKKSAKK